MILIRSAVIAVAPVVSAPAADGREARGGDVGASLAASRPRTDARRDGPAARDRTTALRSRVGRTRAHWSHASTRAPPRAPAVDPRRPRRPARSSPRRARGADEFPKGWRGYPHATPRWSTRSRRSTRPTRASSTGSRSASSYSGRELLAAKISDNVGTRRERARGPVRRPPPRRRAHGPGDDAARSSTGSPTATASSARITVDRGLARGLDRVRDEPRRRRVRHQGRPLPPLAQEPPAERRARAPSARTSTGTTATAGASAAAPAGTPRRSRTTARSRSRRPRPGRCATSSRSRVVGGRQQIRAAITFHEYGPAGDVAVRLHEAERPGGHDERTTTLALRDDRAPHGQRPTATGRSRRATCTSPAGTSRDYLYGTYRDLRVHVRDVGPGLPEDAS